MYLCGKIITYNIFVTMAIVFIIILIIVAIAMIATNIPIKPKPIDEETKEIRTILYAKAFGDFDDITEDDIIE